VRGRGRSLDGSAVGAAAESALELGARAELFPACLEVRGGLGLLVGNRDEIVGVVA